MTAWIVVLLLLVVGLLIARQVFWSRARGRETWWDDPVGWPVSGLDAPSWRAANQRAEALLTGFLTAEQLEALKAMGYLVVPSPRHPGRVYHVPRLPGQVTVYEDGRRVLKLCVQPCVRLPPADRILLHKLMIEGDEERYLDTANQMLPPHG